MKKSWHLRCFKSEFIPIFFGNVLKNIGVYTVKANQFPSFSCCAGSKRFDESNKDRCQISEDVSAYVFKTLVDPSGLLT